MRKQFPHFLAPFPKSRLLARFAKLLSRSPVSIWGSIIQFHREKSFPHLWLWWSWGAARRLEEVTKECCAWTCHTCFRLNSLQSCKFVQRIPIIGPDIGTCWRRLTKNSGEIRHKGCGWGGRGKWWGVWRGERAGRCRRETWKSPILFSLIVSTAL